MPLPVRTINELFDLSGRSAIVTGGSRGLGREMAEGLAEAGASVMLCARREEWLTPTVDAFRGLLAVSEDGAVRERRDYVAAVRDANNRTYHVY